MAYAARFRIMGLFSVIYERKMRTAEKKRRKTEEKLRAGTRLLRIETLFGCLCRMLYTFTDDVTEGANVFALRYNVFAPRFGKRTIAKKSPGAFAAGFSLPYNRNAYGCVAQFQTKRLHRMQKTFADDVTEEANVFALRYISPIPSIPGGRSECARHDSNTRPSGP